MKAIVLNEFGGPEVLRYENVPIPKAAAGEVVLKVYSVSVNRTLDLVVRAGNYPVNIQMPHVLGVDPAGEVVEKGEGVDGFAIGDRVAVVSFIACRRCKQCVKRTRLLCCESTHWSSSLGRTMPSMSLFPPATYSSCRITSAMRKEA